MSLGRALGLPNLRDVGGHLTTDGLRVRAGLLYRSSVLAGLDLTEVDALARSDLRSVFDLRSPAERELRPDVLPDTILYAAVDVLADTSGLTPMQLESALEDPTLAHDLLADQTAAGVSEQRFRDLVRLESARRGFREVFMSLIDSERLPALIHCSTGKDRTGWAAAAFLRLLRVPLEHVMSDYLRSGELLEPTAKPARDAFVQLGGDAGLFDALAGVRRENLMAAFDEMERRYGSIDSYFEEGLGIDASGRTALRSAFVEPALGSK